MTLTPPTTLRELTDLVLDGWYTAAPGSDHARRQALLRIRLGGHLHRLLAPQLSAQQWDALWGHSSTLRSPYAALMEATAVYELLCDMHLV
jgi:hypothetical protein